MTAYPAAIRAEVDGAVTAVVIGAGHAGLAMSHCLSALAIDHLVLERGRVANAWHRERWDSLRLLTPNWQSRLPGFAYRGTDPDGFMTAAETGAFIAAYARAIAAPVHTGVEVTSVQRRGDSYLVNTNQGRWACRGVIIATGAFAAPLVPAVSAALPATVNQYTAHGYRNPGHLPEGGVLVVGGSATGVQLADEICASGRPVVLATGEHVRLPRSYRGLDIQWWLDALGVLDQRHDEIDDLHRAQRVASPQLVGSDTGHTLDLNALQAKGVRIAGRLMGIGGGRAQFSGALANLCALADLKQNRLLDRIDAWAKTRGLDQDLPTPTRPPSTRVDSRPLLTLDLEAAGIRSLVWATGFRPDHSWLQVPVFDAKGRLRHQGGVAAAPGLYVLGLPFMRRRKSSFIHGAGDDTRELAAHFKGYLDSLSGAIPEAAVAATA